MRIRKLKVSLLASFCISSFSGAAVAAEATVTPPAGAAVHEISGPSNQGLDARNWRLDPVVFTEITPFTAPDIAITLPPEQLDEQPIPEREATPVLIEPPAVDPAN